MPLDAHRDPPPERHTRGPEQSSMGWFEWPLPRDDHSAYGTAVRRRRRHMGRARTLRRSTRPGIHHWAATDAVAAALTPTAPGPLPPSLRKHSVGDEAVPSMYRTAAGSSRERNADWTTSASRSLPRGMAGDDQDQAGDKRPSGSLRVRGQSARRSTAAVNAQQSSEALLQVRGGFPHVSTTINYLVAVRALLRRLIDAAA